MLKKIITVQVLLLALLAFASPDFAGAGITKTGKECDKKQGDFCDKKDHRHCDRGDSKAGKTKGDHRHRDQRSGNKGFDILMLADEIGLSDDQVNQVKAIKSAYRKEDIMAQAELDVFELELKELKHDYSTDLKVYAKKVKEIKEKEADRQIARFMMKKDIRKVMTAGQREKIKAYFKNKHKK